MTEETIKRDLGQVLRRAEDLQQEAIRRTLEPKQKAVHLAEEEAREALDLLKDPKLLERILADFDACGLVGEETNKVTAHLAATSRKLDRPLAVIVQSSSAAGKSALMDAVLAFLLEEERPAMSRRQAARRRPQGSTLGSRRNPASWAGSPAPRGRG